MTKYTVTGWSRNQVAYGLVPYEYKSRAIQVACGIADSVPHHCPNHTDALTYKGFPTPSNSARTYASAHSRIATNRKFYYIRVKQSVSHAPINPCFRPGTSLRFAVDD